MPVNARIRIAAAALTLSAAGLVGIALHEGYTGEAVIPVPGDVPTVGFGSTTRDDGSPVRMGDTTTPPKALRKALADIETKYETPLRKCITAPLHQHEYDVFVSLAYNLGPNAFCSSSMARRANAGDYAGACNAIMLYVCGPATEDTRAQPGEQCYHPVKRMRVLRGLVKRREAERRQCLGEGVS